MIPTDRWGRPQVEGHQFFGYVTRGSWKCQCGEVVASSGLLEADSPAVTALKDQWYAHVRDAYAQQQEELQYDATLDPISPYFDPRRW